MSTNGFLLGGLVGFAASFLSKVKNLIKTFRSLFIQRAVIEFNDDKMLYYFIKTGKITLLDRFIDRLFYFVTNLDSDNVKSYVVTPVIYNYCGLAYINNPQNKSLLQKLSNTFYLVKKDNRYFEIYYFRFTNIIDKLFNLLSEDKLKNFCDDEQYHPWSFGINYVKENLITNNQSSSPNATSTKSSKTSSDKLTFPSYLYYNPIEKQYFVNIYKSNFDLYKVFKNVKTPQEYIKYMYPLFYHSKDFETLLRQGIIWQFCNRDSHRKRKVGILLYGPPGTGKSMMITILGTIINVPIYVFDLLNLNQSTVISELSRLVKFNAILLFEDIDVYFEYWNKNKSNNSSLYSKDIIKPSTLLNLIDGVDKQNSCMFIFTTNYPEKIDKRMIDVDTNGNVVITRPGRIDKAIKVGYAEIEGIKHICSQFINLYEITFKREKIDIKLDKNELINLAIDKFNQLDGKLTYANVINICFEYITNIFEAEYPKLSSVLYKPQN